MHNKVFLGTRKKSGSQVRQSQFAVQMADHCLTMAMRLSIRQALITKSHEALTKSYYTRC